MRGPQFKQALSRYKGHISLDELQAELRDSKTAVSPGFLKRMLSLELVLLQADVPGHAPANTTGPWSQIPPKQLQRPVLSLKLETITEFDPHKWSYQDGEWVEP